MSNSQRSLSGLFAHMLTQQSFSSSHCQRNIHLSLLSVGLLLRISARRCISRRRRPIQNGKRNEKKSKMFGIKDPLNRLHQITFFQFVKNINDSSVRMLSEAMPAILIWLNWMKTESNDAGQSKRWKNARIGLMNKKRRNQVQICN